MTVLQQWLRALLIIIAFLAMSGDKAKADRMSVNLTTHQVSITSNFTGATITLFGAIRHAKGYRELRRGEEIAQFDVIVLIKGPEKDVTIRRKERIGGVWVNKAAITFDDVPGFFYVASTRNLEDIASDTMRHRLELSPDDIDLEEFAIHGDGLSPEEIADFQEAVVRQQIRAGLYGYSEGGITMRDHTLFSAKIDVPANVPVGDYKAQILLMRDGVVIDSQSLRPSIIKVGVERAIYKFAHDYSFFYGVFAVVFAGFAGWLASVVFRRD